MDENWYIHTSGSLILKKGRKKEKDKEEEEDEKKPL